MRSLARITGASPSSEGMYAVRMLPRDRLTAVVPEIAARSVQERTAMAGVSAARAPQLLAGALVAEAVLDLLGLDALEICPWALREGIILRRLDAMDQ